MTFCQGKRHWRDFPDDNEGKRQSSFKIFKGVGTDVRVLDVDKDRRQVLLFVKEPKRVFTEVRYDSKQGKNIETIRETFEASRVFGRDGRTAFVYL